jgi:hypothetical protein
VKKFEIAQTGKLHFAAYFRSLDESAEWISRLESVAPAAELGPIFQVFIPEPAKQVNILVDTSKLTFGELVCQLEAIYKTIKIDPA